MQYVINKIINNKWITASIKVSCKCKKSLYIVSKTTNSPIINAFYTQYSIILQKVIRQVKHLYYNELIRTSGNKNKTLWKIINKESGKFNLTKNIPTEFNLGSRFHYNPTKAFNKYCLNIIELRIESNIESTKFSLKAAFPQGFPERIKIPVTESEVKCTIKVLKNKNSSG
jgi:hypothetical protein